MRLTGKTAQARISCFQENRVSMFAVLYVDTYRMKSSVLKYLYSETTYTIIKLKETKRAIFPVNLNILMVSKRNASLNLAKLYVPWHLPSLYDKWRTIIQIFREGLSAVQYTMCLYSCV